MSKNKYFGKKYSLLSNLNNSSPNLKFFEISKWHTVTCTALQYFKKNPSLDDFNLNLAAHKQYTNTSCMLWDIEISKAYS